MNENVMTPEMRAQALQMLGGGSAAQAGQQLAGRGAALAGQEQAAMQAPPMQAPPMQAPPMQLAAQPQPPGMLRKLANTLRGAAK